METNKNNMTSKELYTKAIKLLSDVNTEPQEGLKILEQLAEANCAEALSALGDCYFFGVGKKPNLFSATIYYGKAACELGAAKVPNLKYGLEILRYKCANNDLSQETIDEGLLSVVENNTHVPVVQTGNLKSDYDGYHMLLPEFCDWHGSGGSQNIIISQNDKSKEDAVRCLNNVLLSMLLSVPIKKLKFHIVDLKMSNDAVFLTKNLHPSLYHERIITDEREFQALLKLLKELSTDLMQKCGNVVEHHKETGRIEHPYEVVVLLNVDSDFIEKYREQLEILYDKGHSGGIYFVMTVSDPDFDAENDICINPQPIKEHSTYDLCYPLFFYESNRYNNYFFNYINKTAVAKDKARIVRQDFSALVSSPFVDTISEIDVPVGDDGTTLCHFRMDAESHVHAFVLGQSGSGKSVFLHNVIVNAISKYAPEDLQLYLLDFKLGGVEFNRYSDCKHIRALLVDNNDYQITLEILRDLNDAMRDRGVLLRNAGVSNIKEYNRLHPDEHMPQIIFVADECHVLFSGGGDTPVRVRREMSEILNKVAKEGRSQGVHLLLATQTLAGADISREVLNNITDHYLLKCSPADSESMVNRSSEITSALDTGQVYYHGRSQSSLFQAFYATNDELNNVISGTVAKSAYHKSNGQFYFSGSQQFEIDEKVAEELETKGRRAIVGSVGRTINLQRSIVSFMLKNDFSENVLLFGINDKYQVTNTAVNLFVSMIISNYCKGKDYEFCYINCLDEEDEDARYLDLLDALANMNLCRRIEKRRRGAFLSDLAYDINNESEHHAVILILGQERFREVKLDMDLENASSLRPTNDMMAFSSDPFSQSNSSNFKTYGEALHFILNKGPEVGIHTIMQIDKPESMTFIEYVNAKNVMRLFKHLVMLKSDEKAAVALQLHDDVKLHLLCNDAERMRAFYFDNEKDEYTLLCPFTLPDTEQINKLITIKQ